MTKDERIAELEVLTERLNTNCDFMLKACDWLFYEVFELAFMDGLTWQDRVEAVKRAIESGASTKDERTAELGAELAETTRERDYQNLAWRTEAAKHETTKTDLVYAQKKIIELEAENEQLKAELGIAREIIRQFNSVEGGPNATAQDLGREVAAGLYEVYNRRLKGGDMNGREEGR